MYPSQAGPTGSAAGGGLVLIAPAIPAGAIRTNILARSHGQLLRTLESSRQMVCQFATIGWSTV
jgi:hypothetical protein